MTAVALVGGWFLFARQEHARFVAVDQVRQQRSEIRITYAVDHPDGKLAREEWDFANLNGHSSVTYVATNRNGDRATFTEQETDYGVTFLFDQLVADGVWDLQTRPFRGDDPNVHTVRIQQLAGTQSGSHQFAFSDAHYLATSAGREYHIHLDKDKPVPDLLKLDSTSSADPRYLKILDDVTSFGSPRFKAKIVEARTKVVNLQKS